MNVNAALLFETAILMLAAFLAGAVIGLAARFVLARPKPVVAVKAPEVKPEAAPALVTAPKLDPLPAAKTTPASAAKTAPASAPKPEPAPARRRPTAAQRLAAAAGGRSAATADEEGASTKTPRAPAAGSIAPSRVAGETVEGRHIDHPEQPHAASLDDVRAQLQAQIEADAEDATIVPAALAEKDPEPVEPEDAFEAEDETPMLAAVSEEEAETPTPVEDRVEPTLADKSVALTDDPEEVAAEIQDVIETPDADPVPAVAAETPLVEPVYEREAEEEELTESAFAAADAEKARNDEAAAMRAIEGGWRPRRPTTARKPADLPEGVSPAEVAAADEAVVHSGEAVANATAAASAALAEFPAGRTRPAGGFGRPAAFDAPREGGKDDLTQIKGVNPAIASSLNGLGIYHFDQVADWDQKAVVWIETHFGFKGRIGRERWQEQARGLVSGRPSVARPVRR